jgi:hypothetical protein
MLTCAAILMAEHWSANFGIWIRGCAKDVVGIGLAKGTCEEPDVCVMTVSGDVCTLVDEVAGAAGGAFTTKELGGTAAGAGAMGG